MIKSYNRKVFTEIQSIEVISADLCIYTRYNNIEIKMISWLLYTLRGSRDTILAIRWLMEPSRIERMNQEKKQVIHVSTTKNTSASVMGWFNVVLKSAPEK